MFRATLALLAVAAFAVACTGGSAAPSGVASLGSQSPAPGSSTDPAASIDPEDAILAFAECMREHGVDMPDPQVGANGEISMGIRGDGSNRAEMQAAQEACGDLMEGALGEPRELTPEQKDNMLAFASCMREHGIDMPDPQFEGGGRVMIGGPDGENGPKIDPESSEFQEADEACRDLLGEFGRGPGGPSVSSGGETQVKP
jgi:hypothetical protein